MNPQSMMQFMGALNTFRTNHPKFAGFIGMVMKSGMKVRKRRLAWEIHGENVPKKRCGNTPLTDSVPRRVPPISSGA